MAVEAKRIKERLRSLYPKVNLSTRRIDEISARLAKKPADDADDTAIDGVINDANDFMPFADIAREDDRVRTLEANQKSQDPPKPQDPPQDPPKPQDPPADDVPAWAKTLIETNNSLKADLQELKTGKIIETKKQQAKKVFDANETLKGLKETVKEKWFNRIDVNSETSIEDQISDLEEEYNDLVQVSADSKKSPGAPPNGAGGSKPTDAELDNVVKGL